MYSALTEEDGGALVLIQVIIPSYLFFKRKSNLSSFNTSHILGAIVGAEVKRQ